MYPHWDRLIPFSHCLQGTWVAAAVENSMEVPQKAKNRTSVWPPNSTCSYISEKYQFENIHATPVFIAALFTKVKLWKPPKCPSTDEWIKMWYTYVYIYIHLNHKNNETLPFATTWTGLKCIILSEISQTEKDQYCMISLMCGIYSLLYNTTY